MEFRSSRTALGFLLAFFAIYVFVSSAEDAAASGDEGKEDFSFLEKYNITIEEYEFWKNATNYNGTFPPNLNGILTQRTINFSDGITYFCPQRNNFRRGL